jgi:hypothetical protein
MEKTNIASAQNGASGLNMIAGLWLFLSGFFMNAVTRDVTVHNAIVGGFIVVIAAIRYFGAPKQVWLSWLAALAGLWTIISPWALRFSAVPGPTANNVIVGLVIGSLGCWAAVESGDEFSQGGGRPLETGV